MAVVQLESGQAAIKVVQKLDSHVVQGCTVRVRTNDKVVPFHIGQRKCRLIVRNLAFKVCLLCCASALPMDCTDKLPAVVGPRHASSHSICTFWACDSGHGPA